MDASSELFHELSANMVGYWKTYTLAVAVKLSVAEKCPIPDDDIDTILKLPMNSARVLLNALAELRLIRLCNGVWQLTAKGNFLRVEDPLSLSSAALTWAAFAEGGTDCWLRALYEKTASDIFSDISTNTKKNATMHKMLAAYARHDYDTLSEKLPLAGIRRLIDAGGSNGTTACMVVNASTEINVVVLDRPEVFSFFDTNVGRNIPRISFHPCDIFSPWNIKRDAILLARVLHDWSDTCVLSILHNARAALCSGGKIFIVEMLKQREDANGLCSFHLLTVSGGRERMLAEYQAMMISERFRLLDSYALSGDI